ncbi:MAG TPA: hypothetical protein VFG50_10210 [Rhodothermales bacterium]|nr:hypothetical protein [Rhodothermales bacterium]
MPEDTPIDPEDSVPESIPDSTDADSAFPHIVTVQPIRDPEDEPFVFRFELGPAILQQLLVKLDSLDTHPLTNTVSAKHPGFYQLFLDGNPVYIGKTSRTVGERLREHVKKLRGRIPLSRMACKFAYVEDPSLVDISEGALIRFFDQINAAEWNHSGFGSKATGFNRGQQVSSDWSGLFAPDLWWPVEAGANSDRTLGQIVAQVARQAPITFSIPRNFRAPFNAEHSDSINRPVATKPFVVWVRWIRMLLAEGWRIKETDTGWYIVKEDR